jgi:hypothetical protein
MPQKRKTTQHGLFTIFGATINLNSVLTAVVGTGACMALTYVIHTININSGYIRSIPQLQEDVLVIKKEQARISKEYSPPVAPAPTPTSN